MTILTHDLILVLSVVVAAVAGLIRYKHFDTGTRILFYMVVIDMLAESIGTYTAIRYHTNTVAYNVSSVLDFFLLSMYFNDVIDVFYKRKIGIYMAGGAVVLWILNLFFFQPMSELGTNFLFVEGFVIIAISLFSLYRLLLHHDQLRLFTYHHFWFIAMILLYWSLTFLNFGFYQLIATESGVAIWLIILYANVLWYTGFTIVYLRYPQMQKGDE